MYLPFLGYKQQRELVFVVFVSIIHILARFWAGAQGGIFVFIFIVGF